MSFNSSPSILTSVAVLMILRVYAMWGRSRWIIGVLLLVCIPAMAAQFVIVGMYVSPIVYNIGMSFH